MTRYAMALDTHACIGCLACTLACKVENGSPKGIWLAPVIGDEIGEGAAARRAYLPVLCNHCTDAPCLAACPTGAIGRRPDGIVLIDQDRCCGSGACVIACPYGAIHYYGERQQPLTPFDDAKLVHHQVGTAEKCTFCAPRLDRGLQPACVDACPTGARIFGDRDDPQSAVSRAFAADDAVKLGAPVDTKPNTRYLATGVRRAGGTDADIALALRPQTQWGGLHAVQFWLFALAGGVAVVSRIMPVSLGRFDLGAIMAAVLIAASGAFLVSHLGKPYRFAGAFRNWERSWISRGAIADGVLFVLALVLVFAPPGPVRGFGGALAILAGSLVAIYPAITMASMRSVPAWRGAILPLEAALDALLMGGSIMVALSGAPIRAFGALATLALVRAAFELRGQRPASPTLVLCMGMAALVGLLVFTGIVAPAAALPAAAILAVFALAGGLESKRAMLAAGQSPSPFGPAGEIRGVRRAAH